MRGIMSKNKIVLTPFEKARINIQKIAENFNIYNSIVMLSEALEDMKELSEEERKDIEILFISVVQQMSEYFEESGVKWN
jgi:hypothetical protein